MRIRALSADEVQEEDYIISLGERLRVVGLAGNETIIEFLVLDEKGKYHRVKRPRKGLTYVEER